MAITQSFCLVVFMLELHIMNAFKEQKLDHLGIIRRLSTLFCGNQELLLGFNVFLLESYRIEASSGSRDESVTHEETKMQLDAIESDRIYSELEKTSGLDTAEITPSSTNDPTNTHAEDDKQESEGSHTANGDGSISYQLYRPSVQLDDVVIPRETKNRVRDAVVSFEKVKEKYYAHEVRRKKDFHGLGQSILFYGSSGT